MASVNSAVISYLRKVGVSSRLVDELSAELKVDAGIPTDIDLEAAVVAYQESHLPEKPAALSPEMEEKFKGYIDLIASRGYFKNHAEGSAEYQSLHEKASRRFIEKFARSNSQDASGTELSKEEKEKKGDELKDRGNAFFRDRKYAEAITAYTEAIQVNPSNAIYYANRALVLLRMNRNEDAIDDCKKSIEADPKYVRAYARLAEAQANLKLFEDALHSIEEAIDLEDNPTYKSKRDEILAKKTLSEGGTAGGGFTPPANQAGGGGFPGFPGGLNLPAGMENLPMGPNGMPDVASMMSNPEFLQMAQQMVQNNPELMRMAEQMMQDPQALQQMFGNMPGGMGGFPGFPPPGAGGAGAATNQ